MKLLGTRAHHGKNWKKGQGQCQSRLWTTLMMRTKRQLCLLTLGASQYPIHHFFAFGLRPSTELLQGLGDPNFDPKTPIRLMHFLTEFPRLDVINPTLHRTTRSSWLLSSATFQESSVAMQCFQWGRCYLGVLEITTPKPRILSPWHYAPLAPRLII